MKTATVIQHVPHEGLGAFESVLDERGYAITYVMASVDPLPLSAADLVIVLGGAIGINDAAEYPRIADEVAWLKRRLDRDLPTLGICLGGQLIASALGAEVGSGTQEIGFAPIEVAQAQSNPLRFFSENEVLHWHCDEFAVPDGCERLASTSACQNQAFRRGSNILALQFHPEVRYQDFELWLVCDAYELAGNGISPSALREQCLRQAETRQSVSREFFSAWLDELR